MKVIERPGRIDEAGKVHLINESSLMEWIRSNRDKEIVLTIEIRSKKRSNPLNRYYWGVLIPMVRSAINDLGNDLSKEEVHEFLKARFNYKEVEILDGHHIEVPMSTTDLDNSSFIAYKEKIQQFGAELLGIYIPDPNENIPAF